MCACSNHAGSTIFTYNNTHQRTQARMSIYGSLLGVIFIHLFALLAASLNVTTVKIASIPFLLPPLDIITVFYFSAFRDIFSLVFVCFLGVWTDAVNGTPIGTTSLCYLVIIKLFAFLNAKITLRDNFKYIWQQFIMFAFSFYLMKWTLLSLVNLTLYNFSPLLIQLLLGSAIYALMHKIFDSIARKILEG